MDEFQCSPVYAARVLVRDDRQTKTLSIPGPPRPRAPCPEAVDKAQVSLGPHSPGCWLLWTARPCLWSGLGNLSLPLSPEPQGRR